MPLSALRSRSPSGRRDPPRSPRSFCARARPRCARRTFPGRGSSSSGPRREDPGDVVTWGLLAEVRQQADDPRGAAEACESLARTSVVDEHQLLAWYDAGRLWLDEVADEGSRAERLRASRSHRSHLPGCLPPAQRALHASAATGASWPRSSSADSSPPPTTTTASSSKWSALRCSFGGRCPWRAPRPRVGAGDEGRPRRRARDVRGPLRLPAGLGGRGAVLGPPRAPRPGARTSSATSTSGSASSTPSTP